MVWAFGVLLAAVVAVGESPRLVPGSLGAKSPSKSPSVVPAVVGGVNGKTKAKGQVGKRTVFSKELSGGRSVDVVFGSAGAIAGAAEVRKEDAKGEGKGADVKAEAKGDDVLSYRFNLKTPGAPTQEMTRWDYSADADLRAVEVLDVSVNGSSELAVVVWNEAEYVWADAMTRDAEGKWKTLPRLPYFLDDGTNSLGRGARFAETVIDDQNGVVVTVTHFDGTVDQYRMKVADRVIWEKVK